MSCYLYSCISLPIYLLLIIFLYLYIYLSISLSLSLSIYIYIYIYMCVCVCVCVCARKGVSISIYLFGKKELVKLLLVVRHRWFNLQPWRNNQECLLGYAAVRGREKSTSISFLQIWKVIFSVSRKFSKY